MRPAPLALRPMDTNTGKLRTLRFPAPLNTSLFKTLTFAARPVESQDVESVWNRNLQPRRLRLNAPFGLYLWPWSLASAVRLCLWLCPWTLLWTFVLYLAFAFGRCLSSLPPAAATQSETSFFNRASARAAAQNVPSPTKTPPPLFPTHPQTT